MVAPRRLSVGAAVVALGQGNTGVRPGALGGTACDACCLFPARTDGLWTRHQPRDDVLVRGRDQPFDGWLIEANTRFDRHMTHVLARTLKQARWIRKRGAVKETNVDVISEHTHIRERRVLDARGRETIVH
jgi:hypothetical protein